MPSAVPAARRELLDLLVEEFAADDADVSFAVPSRESPVTVVLTGYLETGEEYRILGSARTDESFQLQVMITVQRPSGDDPFDVEQEALDLTDRVRDLVKADVTLAGTVQLCLFAEQSGGLADNVTTAPMEGGGWGSQIDVRINCAQRIT